jgi:hypothetical protein
MTTTTTPPETIHVLIREPRYAGLGDGCVHAAALLPGDLPEPEEGGDEIMMSSHWADRPDELHPSDRILTLAREGRTFGVCQNGYDVGCWTAEGKPSGAAFNYRNDRWTWTREEAGYLQAWLMVLGEWETTED